MKFRDLFVSKKTAEAGPGYPIGNYTIAQHKKKRKNIYKMKKFLKNYFWSNGRLTYIKVLLIYICAIFSNWNICNPHNVICELSCGSKDVRGRLFLPFEWAPMYHNPAQSIRCDITSTTPKRQQKCCHITSWTPKGHQ